jgi:hypothetical protein
LLKLPNWEEFMSETIMFGGFLSAEEIEMYFPTKELKKINRKFVLGIFGALYPKLAMKYFQETYDLKMRSRLPQVKVKSLDIEPEWLDKLLQFEVPPSK